MQLGTHLIHPPVSCTTPHSRPPCSAPRHNKYAPLPAHDNPTGTPAVPGPPDFIYFPLRCDSPSRNSPTRCHEIRPPSSCPAQRQFLHIWKLLLLSPPVHLLLPSHLLLLSLLPPTSPLHPPPTPPLRLIQSPPLHLLLLPPPHLLPPSHVLSPESSATLLIFLLIQIEVFVAQSVCFRSFLKRWNCSVERHRPSWIASVAATETRTLQHGKTILCSGQLHPYSRIFWGALSLEGMK